MSPRILLVVLAAFAPAPQDKGAPNVAMCEGCHGIPGYKTAFPSVYHVPLIAGQQPDLVPRSRKERRCSHPSMRGIAASLTEEDMRYAEYYGSKK